jgi:hypothetical protein
VVRRRLASKVARHRAACRVVRRRVVQEAVRRVAQEAVRWDHKFRALRLLLDNGARRKYL